jgi:FtsP/CotA-like multicopper oxidase with cupredoxin domain
VWPPVDSQTTRTYDFNIGYAAGDPDGFLRRMTVVNHQYPGPLIECNEGDTLIIRVHNQLEDGQAIHWHGISQNGSNWADGVPGVSQCPIPAGSSFTYKYTVSNQYGTFWWHSHFGNTLGDGVVGG